LIVLYDPQIRSQLQTSQLFSSYNSEKDRGWKIGDLELVEQNREQTED
jgi:hypothetical protein